MLNLKPFVIIYRNLSAWSNVDQRTQCKNLDYGNVCNKSEKKVPNSIHFVKTFSKMQLFTWTKMLKFNLRFVLLWKFVVSMMHIIQIHVLSHVFSKHSHISIYMLAWWTCKYTYTLNTVYYCNQVVGEHTYLKSQISLFLLKSQKQLMRVE